MSSLSLPHCDGKPNPQILTVSPHLIPSPLVFLISQSLCLSPHCAICVGLGMHRLIDSVITSDTVKKKAHHLSHDMHLPWIAIEHQRRPDTDYTDSQESVIVCPPLPTSARILSLMLSHEAARINQYGRQGEWHSLVFWEPAAGDFETVGSMLMKLWVPSDGKRGINQFHLLFTHHLRMCMKWSAIFFFQTLLKKCNHIVVRLLIGEVNRKRMRF